MAFLSSGFLAIFLGRCIGGSHMVCISNHNFIYDLSNLAGVEKETVQKFNSAYFCIFILLRYYWGPRFFGYLNFLRPFVFIFTAFAIVNLKYKKVYIGLTLLFFIIFFSYPRNISELVQDSFSASVRNKVSALEQKYPNKNFTLYTCAKKYISTYNSVAFSIYFFLELNNKASDKGVKIALENDCDYPLNESAEKIGYPILDNIRNFTLRDFSSASNSAILEAGWKPLTFAGMYKQYARWWFELQP